MAGHSKWANTRHRKASQDARKNKIFTRIIKQITVATHQGGQDVRTNPALRAAMDLAISQNMTRDTIKRAIARATGAESGNPMEEIMYEGYGPAGVAIMVECLTDNRNRTVSSLRHAFNSAGGSLGTSGSVAYQFQRQGVLEFAAEHDEAILLAMALEAGADDLQAAADGGHRVITEWTRLHEVLEYFQRHELQPEFHDVVMTPSIGTPVAGEDQDRLQRLLDALEDHQDVQDAWHSAVWQEAA